MDAAAASPRDVRLSATTIPGMDVRSLIEARTYFDLFGVPQRFTLDKQDLQSRYLHLTRLTHPDALGLAGTDNELALVDLSAKVNQAYAVLSDDFRRAEYLIALNGAEPRTDLTDADLAEIFDLRDELRTAQIAKDAPSVEAFTRRAQIWLAQVLSHLAQSLDDSANLDDAARLLTLARYIARITNPS